VFVIGAQSLYETYQRARALGRGDTMVSEPQISYSIELCGKVGDDGNQLPKIVADVRFADDIEVIPT
jgi:hypothetical protein